MTSLPSSMRAVHHIAYGEIGPTTLRLDTGVPLPVPKEGEALIRVAAASINPVDFKILKGYLALFVKRRFPHIPLFDFSGEIVSINPPSSSSKWNPSALAVGAKVMCDNGNGVRCGAFAEYVTAPVRFLSPIPSNLALHTAAAIPLAALTSYQALFTHARLTPNDTVLIIGGSGGTGMFGVQMAKAHGCTVICTCSERNVEVCKKWGADVVVDYTKTSWWDWVDEKRKEGKEAKDGEKKAEGKESFRGIDVIYNCAGDYTDWVHAQRLLNKNGRFITIRGDDQGLKTVWDTVKMVGGLINRKIQSFHGLKIHYKYMLTDSDRIEDLLAIKKMVEDGKINEVFVEKEYKMSEFLDFYKRSETGRVRGKIIVRMDAEEAEHKVDEGKGSVDEKKASATEASTAAPSSSAPSASSSTSSSTVDSKPPSS